MSEGALAARLAGKWRRERGTPISARLTKAASYTYDIARARVYLRRANRAASDIRVVGRPIIRNRGNLSIGDRTIFRSIVAPVEITVADGASMVIGDDTHVNSGTTICAFKDIQIGARVEIATYVSIYDSNFHELYDRNAVPPPHPVIIEDDVWICTKVTILPGVRVGRGAVIAANAVVNRDVEPFTIVGGVPAKVVGRMDPSRFISRGG